MDFSQFLSENPTPVTVTNSTTQKVKVSIKSVIQKKPDIIDEEDDISYEPHTFKRGDFIMVQYLKNSRLSIYKGYFGEIKIYRKEQNAAYVYLHALSHSPLIKFPIKHLVHKSSF